MGDQADGPKGKRSLGGWIFALIVVGGIGAAIVSFVLPKIWPDNKPPVADLKLSANTGYAPMNVIFDGANSVDPEGQKLSFEWAVDGRVVSTEEAHAFVFDSAGSYRVTLKVTDPKGLQNIGSELVEVSIKEPPPLDTAQKSIERSQAEHKVEIEKLVGSWISAYLQGDIAAVLRPAAEPFYFDQEILLTHGDLREAYLKLREEKGHRWDKFRVSSIKVYTLSELKEQGVDLADDRTYRNLNVSMKDFSVVITFRGEDSEEGSTALVVRPSDHEYEIVGMWD